MAKKNDAEGKRGEFLMIKMDPREKEAIRKKADAVGLTMSGYVRFVLLHDAKVTDAKGTEAGDTE